MKQKNQQLIALAFIYMLLNERTIAATRNDASDAQSNASPIKEVVCNELLEGVEKTATSVSAMKASWAEMTQKNQKPSNTILDKSANLLRETGKKIGVIGKYGYFREQGILLLQNQKATRNFVINAKTAIQGLEELQGRAQEDREQDCTAVDDKKATNAMNELVALISHEDRVMIRNMFEQPDPLNALVSSIENNLDQLPATSLLAVDEAPDESITQQFFALGADLDKAEDELYQAYGRLDSKFGVETFSYADSSSLISSQEGGVLSSGMFGGINDFKLAFALVVWLMGLILFCAVTIVGFVITLVKLLLCALKSLGAKIFGNDLKQTFKTCFNRKNEDGGVTDPNRSQRRDYRNGLKKFFSDIDGKWRNDIWEFTRYCGGYLRATLTRDDRP